SFYSHSRHIAKIPNMSRMRPKAFPTLNSSPNPNKNGPKTTKGDVENTSPFSIFINSLFYKSDLILSLFFHQETTTDQIIAFIEYCRLTWGNPFYIMDEIHLHDISLLGQGRDST